MSAPLDLIIVLRELGACEESLAWLAKRRAEDPGASFAKRWAEAATARPHGGGGWQAWAALASGMQTPFCSCQDCWEANHPGQLAASADTVQRGLHAAFLRIATPAEVEAARMVRR